MKDLKQRIEVVEGQRKNKEQELVLEQESLVNLQKNVERIVKELQDLKDMEAALIQKMVNQQREQIKQMISVKGLKEKLLEKDGILENLKSKGKTLMGYVDTKIGSEWFDEHYNKYKNECKRIGEEIKSREDYKKVVDKIGGAVKTIKESDIIRLIKEDKEVEPKRIVGDKQEGINSWFKTSKNDLSYESYTKYMKDTYANGECAEILYKDSATSFKKALNKITNEMN